ncbi:MAG: tetraprenyl-beta-curcumene synthase family protein [Sporomusaceae bacterium]|nr:tetraprenyl-beta-curcumene synthase family protein [Sporomusaceae bacterium]
MTSCLSNWPLLLRLIGQNFPLVKQKLAFWQKSACEQLEPRLRHEALSSLRQKQFHCLGGSVFSLYPGVKRQELTEFIVAFQTISDYLDNLCDRLGPMEAKCFAQLHEAMLRAVTPKAPQIDYYALYPITCDRGYLYDLVSACQKVLSNLPAYDQVQQDVYEFTRLYVELQTYKHLTVGKREPALTAWNEQHSNTYPELIGYEFAAAAGSTLAIFYLCALASQPALPREKITAAKTLYFPTICALHILLDYYIDREEDRLHNDLNFFSAYDSLLQGEKRLHFFVTEAYRQTESLQTMMAITPSSLSVPLSRKEILFTKTVISGLLALYLSDEKISTKQEKALRSKLLSASSEAKFFYYLCLILRRCHKL